MMSLAPVFASLGRAGKKNNFENSQKIEVSTKGKKFLQNLAQCDIKIYCGPKNFLGL